MLHFSHAATNRRTSSCMSLAFDDLRPAAPFAAMLSVSRSTVLPANNPPNCSTTRTTPSSSRQLIGRRRSAHVNASCDSMR